MRPNFDVLDGDGDHRTAAEMTDAEILRLDAETRAHMREHSVRAAARVPRTIRDATGVDRRPVRGRPARRPVLARSRRTSRSPVVRSRTSAGRSVRRRARAPGREPGEPDPPDARVGGPARVGAAGTDRPTLDRVLGAVRPGHVVPLRVPAGFLDAHPDNSVAVSVVQHVAWARKRVGASDDLPLTDATIRAVAAKLGHVVPLKRCARVRHGLLAAGVIVDAGTYRQRYTLGPAFRGFRVSVYRVIRAAAGAVPGTRQASVSPCVRVKRPRRRIAWFETVLGSLDGRPPPGISKRDRSRMRTLDDLRAPGSAAA